MKICFLTGIMHDGGAERVISVLANRLSQMKIDVYVYVFCRSEKDYPINADVHLEYMYHNAAAYEECGAMKRLVNVRNYLKRVRPDVAVGFIQGGYALYLSGIGIHMKRVASLRVNPAENFKEKNIRAFLDRLWFRRADAVVIQCKGQLSYALSHGWRNVSIIGNPVNENILNIQIKEYREQCKKFVMAGRLDRQKNYSMAIMAFHEIHHLYEDVQLHIYGQGVQESAIKALIEKYSLTDVVQLHGWSKNIWKEYQKYDAFLMTSDYEGLPNSLMEAMGTGLPCISTDCPTGPSDLIEEGVTGFLVPVGEKSELTKKIRKLIEMNKEDRRSIGQSARSYIIRNFHADVVAGEWSRLAYRLANKGNGV